MTTVEELEKYFSEHCPELGVHFTTIPEPRLRSTWYLEQLVDTTAPPEFVKAEFLDHIYQWIGKMTVIAEKMRNTPIDRLRRKGTRRSSRTWQRSIVT
jgi:hypothetical protein